MTIGSNPGTFTGMVGWFDCRKCGFYNSPAGERYILIDFLEANGGETQRHSVVIRKEKFDEFSSALIEQSEGTAPTIHGFLRKEGTLELHEAGSRHYAGNLAALRHGRQNGTSWTVGFLDIETEDGSLRLPFKAAGEDASRIGQMKPGDPVALWGHIIREAEHEGRACLQVHYSRRPQPERVHRPAAEAAF